MRITRELGRGLVNIILLLSRTPGFFKCVLEVPATRVAIMRAKQRQTKLCSFSSFNEK